MGTISLLIKEVRLWHLRWLVRNAHPLCPEMPKWVLKERSIGTGRWY